MKKAAENKKKILFYVDSLAAGGLGKMVVETVNHLDFDKYDITVMQRFPGEYYSNFLDKRVHTKSNLPFRESFSKYYNYLARVLCDRIPRKMMYKLFIHKKYDIEVACDDAFTARLIGGSTNKKSKKILWEHMDVMKDVSSATYFSLKKVRWFFSPFDKIVGVSKDCEKKFIEKYGFEDKTMYIYNPVDVAEVEKKSKAFTVEEFQNGRFHMIAVGSCVKVKGFDRLVRVCEKLRSEGLDFDLLIIGEGPEKEKIQAQIDAAGLADRITLLGYKENPYPYIKAADLLICSSIHESYSLVIAESLIVGTPVISTECTGPGELLDNGKYGMLVENTEQGIYDGLRQLTGCPDTLRYYKEQTGHRKNFFDVEKSIKAWEELFEE